jgi:5-methylcytosine-specific restriction endonuclease McrA
MAAEGADEPLNREPAVESFYTSWIWRKCRKAFAESKGNLCERCLKRGIIQPGSKEHPLEVHHVTPLTADNVKDPDVALAWSNLMLLCKSCHDEERERKAKRWRIGPDGRVQV